MNGLQYWFDGDKANLPTLKTNFQTIFQKTDADGKNIVFEKIWANNLLRRSIWNDIPINPNDDDKETYKSRFETLILSTSNSFYSFIKVK